MGDSGVDMTGDVDSAHSGLEPYQLEPLAKSSDRCFYRRDGANMTVDATISATLKIQLQ